jgi:hypothetical protein
MSVIRVVAVIGVAVPGAPPFGFKGGFFLSMLGCAFVFRSHPWERQSPDWRVYPEAAVSPEEKSISMIINDPETIAELKALYPLYETALVNNDADTLTRMFWSSPQAMRFGLNENLYGIDEIESFRKGRSPANLTRTVRRFDIVTFGRDVASITLEFERTINGQSRQGRQSQLWVRLPEGWRIVSAHVSMLPAESPK